MGRYPRSVTEFYGGIDFFSLCTRHVSMYLRHGIVILSFILSHGALFLLMSPGILV